MSVEKDIQNLTKAVQALLNHLETNNVQAANITLPGAAAAAAQPAPAPAVSSAAPASAQVAPAASTAPPTIYTPEQQAAILGSQVQQPEPVATLTLEQVNDTLVQEMGRIGDFGGPVISRLIQARGVNTLPELPAEQYASLVAEVHATPVGSQ